VLADRVVAWQHPSELLQRRGLHRNLVPLRIRRAVIEETDSSRRASATRPEAGRGPAPNRCSNHPTGAGRSPCRRRTH
jgi:hypothetical protein